MTVLSKLYPTVRLVQSCRSNYVFLFGCVVVFVVLCPRTSHSLLSSMAFIYEIYYLLFISYVAILHICIFNLILNYSNFDFLF